MRITFVLPHASLAGGIRVVAIYAERLQRRGHNVTVISLPKPPLTLKQRVKIFFKEGRWPGIEKDPSHLDGLNFEHRILKKYRPVVNADVPDGDAVIATWWETAEWVNSLQSSKGKKIYFVQGHEILHGFLVERVKATYLLPLHKVTVSCWLANIMKNEYGDVNVDLVPNSVDFNFFNDTAMELRAPPTIGFVYSTNHFKGCDIVIEALNRVRVNIPTLKIKAFGSCSLSNILPLPENTEFYFQPTQEEIRNLYSSCDFWLFSSRAEGFGLPILEAMACRTPVIATRAGAAPELIGKGGGLLLDDWSVEGMSDTIVKALNMSPEDWRAMSCRAREIATGYSWDDATLLFEKGLVS